MCNSKRFIETTAEKIGEEPDGEFSITPTKWWLDTNRPLPKAEDPKNVGYIAVQTEADKDPNNFYRCTGMQILYTDEAEYYFVCRNCYDIYQDMQWSGSTESEGDWKKNAEDELQQHEKQKGWCEFCDPVFGNGGWHLD